MNHSDQDVVGAVVRLNSGGPPMMALGETDGDLSVAWGQGGAIAATTMPRECVTRIDVE